MPDTRQSPQKKAASRKRDQSPKQGSSSPAGPRTPISSKKSAQKGKATAEPKMVETRPVSAVATPPTGRAASDASATGLLETRAGTTPPPIDTRTRPPPNPVPLIFEGAYQNVIAEVKRDLSGRLEPRQKRTLFRVGFANAMSKVLGYPISEAITSDEGDLRDGCVVGLKPEGSMMDADLGDIKKIMTYEGGVAEHGPEGNMLYLRFANNDGAREIKGFRSLLWNGRLYLYVWPRPAGDYNELPAPDEKICHLLWGPLDYPSDIIKHILLDIWPDCGVAVMNGSYGFKLTPKDGTQSAWIRFLLHSYSIGGYPTKVTVMNEVKIPAQRK